MASGPIRSRSISSRSRPSRPAHRSCSTLLGSANVRDRKPVWQRYDHTIVTNTVVGPGAGDACGSPAEGHQRRHGARDRRSWPRAPGALDPTSRGLGGRSRRAQRRLLGRAPLAITDCLNFGTPETDLGPGSSSGRSTGLPMPAGARPPVVSGNVSLYNETPDGPILPTPVVGTLVSSPIAISRYRWRGAAATRSG